MQWRDLLGGFLSGWIVGATFSPIHGSCLLAVLKPVYGAWNDMKSLTVIAALSAALLLGGCATSSLSTLPVAARPSQPMNVIAMAPGGGILADAVGVELANRGFNVIDVSTTSQMLVRLNLSEIEISQPQGLAKLKSQGVDGFLVVRAAAGYDGMPQSASARVNSTETGQVVSGVSWQNGWGGQAGSIADRTMRSGLTGAASEIADALARNLK